MDSVWLGEGVGARLLAIRSLKQQGGSDAVAAAGRADQEELIGIPPSFHISNEIHQHFSLIIETSNYIGVNTHIDR